MLDETSEHGRTVEGEDYKRCVEHKFHQEGQEYTGLYDKHVGLFC